MPKPIGGSSSAANISRSLREEEPTLRNYYSTHERFNAYAYDATVWTMEAAPNYYIGGLGLGCSIVKEPLAPVQIMHSDPLSDANRGQISRPSTCTLWGDYVLRPLGFCE